MKIRALRLQPDQDLKVSLKNYARENQIKAGVILTCVGSLKLATLRMANGLDVKIFEDKYELVSLVGTFSADGCHLHISLSDRNGNVIGGHVKEGCMIFTTAEIVLGEIQNMSFTREMDNNTGFKELVIKQRSDIS